MFLSIWVIKSEPVKKMATCKKSFLPPPCDQLPTAPHDQVRPPPIGNECRAVFVKSEIFDIVGIPVFFLVFWHCWIRLFKEIQISRVGFDFESMLMTYTLFSTEYNRRLKYPPIKQTHKLHTTNLPSTCHVPCLIDLFYQCLENQP